MTRTLLNKYWKFFLDDPQAAQNHSYWDKGYNDHHWKNVTLPHDWSVEYPFSPSHSSGTGYVAGGIGWYRLSFNVPEEMQGKKCWIIFDGIYKNSQVWCNSYYLGKWPFGYTTFKYDISQFLCYGDVPNNITVKVSHTDIADSRWFTGSGITRKVSLLFQEPVHVVQDSLFFSTPKVSALSADINTAFLIENDSNTTKEIKATLLLKDSDQKVCLTTETHFTLLSKQCHNVSISESLNDPLLWSADSPNLYTLEVILSYDDISYLAESMQVGIRSIHFDPNEGFFVNGRSEKLKGVCLHHDAGCLGAAVHKNVWKRRLLKLKAMGSNAVRCSHNPHMPELYDLCDEMGFYVIDEAFDEWEGPKNKWSTGHNVYPPLHQGYYEDFPQWYEKDLSAMVLRDRNHPSVILWSTGNEIDYPNDPYCHPLFETMTGNNDANKPASERQYNPNKPNAERLSVLAKMLTDCVKKYDTTRGVTLAAAYPELSTYIGFIDSLDVVGYNYKEEYYEADHQRFPDKPFMGSECNHTYDNWLAAKNNPYISGQFLWTGIDYLGEAYGWPIHGSSAGLLTLAGFEKSGYGFRQSLWTDEPVLSVITSATPIIEPYNHYYANWNYNHNELITIRAYTNCTVAEAFLNGLSIGKHDYNDKLGYIEWHIPYAEGVLTIEATAKDGAKLTKSITSNAAPVSIHLEQWDTEATADGEMLVQIEVTLLDAQNQPCFSACNKLSVTVEGEATLVGLENGDLSDVTAYTEPYRHAYNGQLLIYCRTTETAGSANVIVKGTALPTAVHTITTK